MRQLGPVLILSVCLPGCLCSLSVKEVGTIPADWESGPELVVLSDARYHQGGGYSNLMLNETAGKRL